MSRFCKGKVVRFFLFFVLIAVTAQLAAPVSYAEKDNPFKKLGVQVFEKRPKAPDFTLRRINGTEIRLSDLKGKVVFINFFATWCTPCRYEMPEMEALYKTFKDKNLEILAISIDSTLAPIKPFADSMKLTFPIAHDPGMKVARQFGLRGPPLSYFIDRKGFVVGGAQGPRNWNDALAHQIVNKLLAEPAS
jgi:peroxiredoxin